LLQELVELHGGLPFGCAHRLAIRCSISSSGWGHT
jgi:hypothetical protein